MQETNAGKTLDFDETAFFEGLADDTEAAAEQTDSQLAADALLDGQTADKPDGTDKSAGEDAAKAAKDGEVKPVEGQSDEGVKDSSDGQTADKPDGQTAAQKDGETADAQTGADSGEKPGIEVTFLGEKKVVPITEAVSLVQKGMNYDRVSAKVARLEAELAAPRARDGMAAQMSRYAKAQGVTVESLLSQMKSAADEKGIPAEAPAKSDYFMERAAEDWKDFMKTYPEIRDPTAELPGEVWDAINSGLTPRQAVAEYKAKQSGETMAQKDKEISTLKEQLAAAKATAVKNEQTRAKAPGSVGSTAPGREEDDFLAGFSEGF